MQWNALACACLCMRRLARLSDACCIQMFAIEAKLCENVEEVCDIQLLMTRCANSFWRSRPVESSWCNDITTELACVVLQFCYRLNYPFTVHAVHRVEQRQESYLASNHSCTEIQSGCLFELGLAIFVLTPM